MPSVKLDASFAGRLYNALPFVERMRRNAPPPARRDRRDLVPWQFRRFELAEDLDPGGEALAWPLDWDGADYEARDAEEGDRFKVVDVSGFRGRGRVAAHSGLPAIAGGRGWAIHAMDRGAADPASDTWEVVSLGQDLVVRFGLKTRFAVPENTTVGYAYGEAVLLRADGTADETVELDVYLLVPPLPLTIGRDEIAALSNPGDLQPTRGYAIWMPDAGRWDVLRLDAGPHWVKVDASHANFTGSPPAAVTSVKASPCDADGVGVLNLALSIPLRSNDDEAPALFAGDVVPIGTMDDAFDDWGDGQDECWISTPVLLEHRYSARYGAIVVDYADYAGYTPPRGWRICDGTHNTPAALGRFPVFAGQGPHTNYQKGQQGGYERHGQTENNHIDHAQHNHFPKGTVGAAAGNDVTCWDGTKASNTPDSDPAGNLPANAQGHFGFDGQQQASDVDNRPPHTVIGIPRMREY